MQPEFKVHLLNEQGISKAQVIAKILDTALTELEKICPPSREFSITRTKLEEASFFAKKSMAKDLINQKQGE